MEALIFATLTLAAGNIFCALAILGELRKRPQAPSSAPAQAAAAAAEDPAQPPRSLRLEEGFENLMAYQVKLGRGRTTGGEAE